MAALARETRRMRCAPAMLPGKHGTMGAIRQGMQSGPAGMSLAQGHPTCTLCRSSICSWMSSGLADGVAVICAMCSRTSSEATRHSSSTCARRSAAQHGAQRAQRGQWLPASVERLLAEVGCAWSSRERPPFLVELLPATPIGVAPKPASQRHSKGLACCRPTASSPGAAPHPPPPPSLSHPSPPSHPTPAAPELPSAAS